MWHFAHTTSFHEMFPQNDKLQPGLSSRSLNLLKMKSQATKEEKNSRRDAPTKK
jgi:hypothetical protein